MGNDLVRAYRRIINGLEDKNKEVSKDYWRLGYHLMPPMGWLNDPNGLCEINGEYHVYYQYSPFEPQGGLKFWGHYSSKDLINWTEHKIALYPDQPFDCHGVFSGTAYVEDNKGYIYYTGMFQRQGYSDFTIKGMEQNTVLVTTEDGINFSKKKLLLRNEDYPENMSWHVRDPKVWKENNKYYMILGARDLNSTGCALLYESDDKENWIYLKRIDSKEKFGFMWECPDYFKLDNNKVFITCPQGVERTYELPNIHQCGYFLIDGDITSEEYSLSKFKPLDRGFDFYAPQTFKDSMGRRILIGWVSLSDCEFKNPTIEKGWQHCLSIPRELNIIDGKLHQSPVKELEKLRCDKVEINLNNKENCILQGDKYELELNFNECPKELNIKLKSEVSIAYSSDKNVFKLTMGQCGYGRDKREISLNELSNIRIFGDTSILEIFLNNGEEVFTTRVYSNKNDTKIEINGQDLNGNGVMYTLKEFNYN